MTLDASEENLAVHYLATIQAICVSYLTSHICVYNTVIIILFLVWDSPYNRIFGGTRRGNWVFVALRWADQNRLVRCHHGGRCWSTCCSPEQERVCSSRFSYAGSLRLNAFLLSQRSNDENGWSWKNNSTESTRQKVFN